jgi:hypothetical protein
MHDARLSALKLQLYGSACCHLCEQAASILMEVGVQAEHVDILEDDALLEIYGTRIPVVKNLYDGSELGWPFDAEMLKRWLA